MVRDIEVRRRTRLCRLSSRVGVGLSGVPPVVAPAVIVSNVSDTDFTVELVDSAPVDSYLVLVYTDQGITLFGQGLVASWAPSEPTDWTGLIVGPPLTPGVQYWVACAFTDDGMTVRPGTKVGPLSPITTVGVILVQVGVGVGSPTVVLDASGSVGDIDHFGWQIEVGNFGVDPDFGPSTTVSTNSTPNNNDTAQCIAYDGGGNQIGIASCLVFSDGSWLISGGTITQANGTTVPLT